VPPKSIGIRFDMDERSHRRYQELIRAGKVKGVGGSFTAGLSDEKSLPRLGKLERFEDEFDPKISAIGVYGNLPNPDGLFCLECRSLYGLISSRRIPRWWCPCRRSIKSLAGDWNTCGS